MQLALIFNDKCWKTFHISSWKTWTSSFTAAWYSIVGLPRWLSGKAFACHSRRHRLRRSPGEGNSYPLQYSGLENSMDRGAWQVLVHGSKRVGHDWACTQDGDIPLCRCTLPYLTTTHWWTCVVFNCYFKIALCIFYFAVVQIHLCNSQEWNFWAIGCTHAR